MENKVVIALDAMGGDYAPVETVKGAVEAVNENKGMKVILVGREEEIKSELAKYTLSLIHILCDLCKRSKRKSGFRKS